MKKALLFCFLLAVAGFSGCETKYVDPDQQAWGHDYLPVQVGDYKIYKVVDIKYQHNIATKDSFEMREVVDTSFYDQTNTLNYKIVRAIKRYDQSEWVEDSVMTLTKTDKFALLTKDNTKYVKLIFPVKEGKVWEGDAFNSHSIDGEKELYTYTNVGEPFELSGQTYASTVTVVQGEPENSFLFLDDRREVYAKGIGRVYRVFNKVVYCNDASACSIDKGYKLNGHERHETLVDYGSR